MNDIAISVKNVSKSFRMYNSPAERLKELLHPFKKKYHKDFWALKDINFDVPKGSKVGIIGLNGSGKSTLLQIICGILQPTNGSVQVNGRISALLELGAGFNRDFTGRENVFMNGAVMGISRKEMEERFDRIAEFADIGHFIDQPVKTYSSGMYVRLAFAVAINVDADILIVDEALSVGDMFFQAKCITKMQKMIETGVTLLFVSHNTGAVKSLCSKAILLNNGIMHDYGEPENVLEKYFSMKVGSEQSLIRSVSEDTVEKLSITNTTFTDNAEFKKKASFQRIQNGLASFVNVQLLDNKGNQAGSLEYDQNVILRMAIEINDDMSALSYGYQIRDMNGVGIVNSNAVIEQKMLNNAKKGERYIVDWKFKVSLMHGSYNIVCVLSIPVNSELAQVVYCDYIPCAVQFQMHKRRPSMLHGYVHWKNAIEVLKVEKN